MIAAIVNASVRNVPQAVAPMPTMRSTIMGWFRPLNLTRVIKQTVDFETKEVEIPLPALGTWQPLSHAQLVIKPEGERAWQWFEIHSTPDLKLEPDDIIFRDITPYRVMAQGSYDDNGFISYHVVNDYQARK
jgi:hypothetical protein